MSASTAALHQVGQSLWLDHITRGILDDGTLAGYLQDFHVTGLTSNPSIYNLAVGTTPFYDEPLATLGSRNVAEEEAFFEIAIEDLRRAADLFRPVFDRTGGVDGWVSLEVSPALAYDTAATLAQAK